MAAPKPDFHYNSPAPGWITLWPLNSQAEDCWRQIAEVYPGGGMSSEQFKDVRSQLKASGYIVRKHYARGLKNETIAQRDRRLLQELGIDVGDSSALGTYLA